MLDVTYEAGRSCREADRSACKRGDKGRVGKTFPEAPIDVV